MNASNKTEWLNTLRAIAILAVVIVHTSTPVVKMSYGVYMNFWWIGNIIDSAVRFSVPAFLMISGVTLLNKQYAILDFYKKRINKVLLPFMFWAPVYYIFRFLSLPTSNQPSTFAETYNWAITLFLEEGISKHFWYIYMILFLYLLTPFIQRLLQYLNTKNVGYFICIWIYICIAYTFGLISTKEWHPFVGKLFYYFLNGGYLLLGYYLNKYDFTSKKHKIIAWCIFAGSIAATAFFTYWISKSAQKLNLMLYGYLSINTIIQSVAIFYIFKDTVIKNNVLTTIKDTLSNYSFGIYLVHILVLGVFFRYGIFWTMYYPIISVPLVGLLCIASSIFIVFLLRQIPYFKYVSG